MMSKLKKIYYLGRRTYQQVLFVAFSDEFRSRRPFNGLRQVYFKDFWQKIAKEASAEIDSVGYGFYRLKRDGFSTFVRHGEVMLDDHLTLDIVGNKPLVYKLLIEKGFHVPDYFEYEMSNLSDAEQFMQARSGNFVVKPASGTGAGAGVTTKVNSVSRLHKASAKASVFSCKLILEQEIEGLSYRLLYLDGEFIDAIRRDSPGVIGDGRSNLKCLVAKENKKRLMTSTAFALSPLIIDLDCKYTLMDRGISLKHIPGNGEKVVIKTAANQYSRDENHSVRDIIHPSIIEFGSELSKVINVSFSGVDLMIKDCTKPLSESGCVVNEINTTPGVHHHELISKSEKAVPVGSIIIEYIFKQMKFQKNKTTRI